ncbi:MAG: BCD family MFS transporter [Chitinophagales bacterium]|nr:BCD family MFS transporter [Hyphomicrobiales bacterium]
MNAQPIGWLGIVRLGLVQTAIGSIVVLTTSTLNRVIVVELALPAMLPGALVALYYTVQLLRPRLGYGSDMGGRRTPWIIGGMAILALGGLKAAGAVALMAQNVYAGVAMGIFAFVLIGVGVGACGTTLLALVAKRVAPERRAAAASILWTMMICGLILTSKLAGNFLDPFSLERLVMVSAVVSAIAFAVTVAAVWGLEGHGAATAPTPASAQTPFRTAFAQVWGERQARQFTIFVFVSMFAYQFQELVLEPFAGDVFAMTAGQTTMLSGDQHMGTLAGMILVAIAGAAFGGRFGSLRAWTAGGCLASAIAVTGLCAAALYGPGFPLRIMVFALGAATGAFAMAAIGSMMALAGSGRGSREGTRMGLWGAAQAIGFGLGAFMGTVTADVARAAFGASEPAYAAVFAIEGALFLIAAHLALGSGQPKNSRVNAQAVAAESFAAGR